MKYVKLFEEHINEIGDASAKPYKYKKDKDYDEEWHFTTDSNIEYSVTMHTQEDPNKVATIEYAIKTAPGRWSHTEVVNRGEVYRVMATIVSIAKDALKADKDIKTIEFSGSKSDGPDDQRRNNLYKAYVKKHLNVKDIEFDGNTVTVELK